MLVCDECSCLVIKQLNCLHAVNFYYQDWLVSGSFYLSEQQKIVFILNTLFLSRCRL
uniref:Uncharacterized protein n=1 Tax=Helianthus annuus TaxID=4232 RepID=A0A251U455_HELAN